MLAAAENMNGFDDEMKLQRYVQPEDIVEAYIPIREAGYVKRKEVQLKVLQAQTQLMENKARFINAIINGEIPMVGGGKNALTDKELVEYLRVKGYLGSEEIFNEQSDSGNTTDSGKDERAPGNQYSYLLNMSISSLTIDRANSLNKRVLELKVELDLLNKTTPAAMWLSDLAKLEAELNKDEAYKR